jgi:hypothetical protein
METSYEIVNIDKVELKMSVTATKEQWSGLLFALSDKDQYCAALKGAIEKMLKSNVLTVTSEL